MRRRIDRHGACVHGQPRRTWATGWKPFARQKATNRMGSAKSLKSSVSRSPLPRRHCRQARTQQTAFVLPGSHRMAENMIRTNWLGRHAPSTIGVTGSMFPTRTKVNAALLLSAGLCMAGAGVTGLTHGALASGQRQRRPEQQLGSEPPKAAPDQLQAPGASAPEGAVRAPWQERVKAILQEARTATEAIEDPQRKAWMLQLIAEEQTNASDQASAKDTFQVATEAAKKIPSDRGNALMSLASVQAATGDVEGARHTAETAIKAGKDRNQALAELAEGEARSLFTVATAQVKRGQLTEAARTVDAIGSDYVRVQALVMLARAQSKALGHQAAERAWERSFKLAAQVGPYAYAEITRAQAEVGDLKAARQTAMAITSEPWKSHASIALQIKSGNFQGAWKTAQTIGQDSQRGEVEKDLALAQCRLHGPTEGLRAADAIKSVYWRVLTLGEIAKVQADFGDREAADVTLKKAFEEAHDVGDNEPGVSGFRRAAFCGIVQAQAEVGAEEDALKWARKQNARLKAQALLSVARGIRSQHEREKSTRSPGTPALAESAQKLPTSPRLEDLPALEHRIHDLYHKVASSAVYLFEDATGDSLGSGVIITTEGYILTHAHNGPEIKPGTAVRVVTGDGRKATGKYVGIHRPADLSLVKLDGKGPWPAAPLGSPDQLRTGDTCLALGWPYAYYREGRPPLLRLGRFLGASMDRLYNSCLMWPGDSGGPLFNLAGELVGVEETGLKEQHGGGHVSVAVYLRLKDELLQGKYARENMGGSLRGDFKGRGPFEDCEGLGGLAATVRPSVVVVRSPDRPIALGLVVAADGWILTKNSVLGDRVLCQLSDGQCLEALVQGRSSDFDLALLKVGATGLPVVPWSSRQPKPGDLVASVGPNPGELVFGAVSSPLMEVPLEKGGRLPFDVRIPEPAEDAAGVQIIDVWNDTPSLKPDIHEYDLLTHIANTPVPTTEEYRRVTKRLFRETVAGERIELTIQRRGKALTLKVAVESADTDASTFPYYGGRRSGFPKAFLHDAWVPRGYNGSAMVDIEGKVIAINLATWLVGTRQSREPGIMYAIPADAVRKLIAELRQR